MKHLTTILAAVLCAVCLSGCNKERIGRGNPNVLYSGQKWDVVKVNDSIVVCLPGLNADSELSPVVVNLHDPDCPCHNK